MTFRPDPKPDPKPKKPYRGIPKISDRRKRERKELHEKDDAFYHEVYNERPHVCQYPGCNAKLVGAFNWSWFHHILAKGKRAFAHLRHEKENIIMVCQFHHDDAESANPTNFFVDLTRKTIQHFVKEEKL